MKNLDTRTLILLWMLVSSFYIYAETAKPSVFDTTENNKINLVYWIPFSGTDARPMADMVRTFNKIQNETFVNMKLIEWSKYYISLKNSFNSEQSPDIAIAHSSILEELYSKELLTDLQPYAKLADIHWEAFFEKSLSKVIREDKYLAIPIDTHVLVMYYNKKHLKKAGLLGSEGQILMAPGLDGFMSLLKTLKSELPENVSPLISATENIYPFWIWYAFYSQIEGGGHYIQNNKAVFNNPKARQALKVLVELQDKGYWPTDIQDLKSYNMFKFGHAAIGFFGVWATGYFEEKNQLEFGATTIPRLFDKEATWGDSHTLILPKLQNELKKIAAVKFAKWITDHGANWAEAGHVPANKQVVSSEAYQKQAKRYDYSKIIDQINFYPNHPKLWQCNEIMVNKITDLLKGKLTIDETLTNAELEINALLQKP